MITEIKLEGVASYKNTTTLETNKQINLIYGLNGSGKTTLSNYLYHLEKKKTEQEEKTEEKEKKNEYENCHPTFKDSEQNYEILVYNQSFIRENFFETENIAGVFTLSKENKAAEEKIKAAENEIKELKNKEEKKTKEGESIKEKINTNQNLTMESLWSIKKTYESGTFDFCLDGYKNKRENLLHYILSIEKPEKEPTETLETLEEKAKSLSSDGEYGKLEQISFKYESESESIEATSIETQELFSEVIVGNENSTVSKLIETLNNSDWVKQGIEHYLKSPTQEENNTTCPFCQEKTISTVFIENIKNYFDASYTNKINQLQAFLKNYATAIEGIPAVSNFNNHPKLDADKFELKYKEFITIIEKNKEKIAAKIKTPSIQIKLESSTKALNELNKIIEETNKLIEKHNHAVKNKEKIKKSIKATFWQIMRWNYDEPITDFNTQKDELDKELKLINDALDFINNNIKAQENIIKEAQKHTLNIKDAILNINKALMDLGFDDFQIEEHPASNHNKQKLYRIKRTEIENEENIFHSLSEGEKMIISFLYFIECCKGKKNANQTNKKKIIVIDDPISSLSHLHIFNISLLIKREFFNEKASLDEKSKQNYEQIFVLTHSLYFFHEITLRRKKERNKNQKLFRLSKNKEGSFLDSMEYEEIQNDYQAYWSIIKNPKQAPALIANCMRNIVEYFFNFVEKHDLNSVFEEESLKDNIRFKAFCRYINRESHSVGPNITDFKEFDYDNFKDGFRELFQLTGYEKHYNKMMEETREEKNPIN